MDNSMLKRYSRHIMLPQMDYEGQETLLNSRVLIMGAGGLGSPVAMYLASSGIGHITICDFDVVEEHNLQRQIMHGEADVGTLKVDSAKHTLQSLNRHIRVETINQKLEGDALRTEIEKADVVLDTTDNFTARFAANKYCVETKTPLVSGSVIRMEGQISTFDPRRDDSPCYHCLYKDTGDLDETCTSNGVLAPAVGIVGGIQATEAIKVLCGFGEPLIGRLLLMDVLTMEWRTMKLKKDPGCPVCGAK
ncbi:MAG: molybdopterin-synthase adenylyltransferase MoeB [Gammaproteobacteria bacterium]|nr:molybdopterin-synthase adenylyltransferase MoeB [Gammaproteobacteria bacterium]